MKLKFVIILFSLVFTGCKNEENKPDSELSKTKNSEVNSEKLKSCFESFQYDLDKILTKDEVLKYIDDSQHSQVETEFKNRNSSMSELIYSYPSERTHTVSVGKMSQNVPDNNIISLKGLSFSKIDEEKTLELFNRKYKKLTEEEFQEMKSNLEKQYADKSKAELETALKFLDTRMQFNSIAVDGLGTSSYWKNFTVNENDYGVELFVLAGTVEFLVHVKISDNDEINSNTAIEIAKDILAKCK